MKIISRGLEHGQRVIWALLLGMLAGSAVDLHQDTFPTFFGVVGLLAALLCYLVLRLKATTS